MTKHLFAILSILGWANIHVLADGPADNQWASVRPMPPPGIAIEEAVRAELQNQLDTLKKEIAELTKSKNAVVQEYLPDVEIFARAVDIALTEDGFFETKDVDRAKQVLKSGLSRASELKNQRTPWAWIADPEGQLTVRGFRSKLDGTVQPYGVVISTGVVAANGVASKSTCRADVWCRGRSEKGLEMQFIATRMSNPDPVPHPGVIMIHPFGRYCNANKLAGEVDTLEAIQHALKSYPIDPNRVAIRGFSMGGAAAWHLAVHYPDKWFAANPGAGFSETQKFLKVFQSEDLKPTWFEEKLWQMYDCPVWIQNLRMLPTIAYSGEIDKQKQAADVMAEASWNLPGDQRFELTHIIAPKTAHKIDPAARVEIEKRLATIDRIEPAPFPKSVTFTTTTLKYNRAHWVTIHALEEHWVPATISAEINVNAKTNNIFVSASNVSEFSLELEADDLPQDVRSLQVYIQSSQRQGGACNIVVQRQSDLSWSVRARKVGDRWEHVSPLEPPPTELAKKHGLQGPIDDAMMGSFLFVKPTAAGRHPKVDHWVESEFNRAVREWHRQMRGDAIVKSSDDLKPEDIENYNLVLWGDPQSNPTLAKLAEKLPIEWTRDNVIVGSRKFESGTHVPIMIYPNPLNPQRYVVLNSSFTYREFDYLNNARQIPKLPDWAVVDVSTPPDTRFPGRIADADFFDEEWKIKPQHEGAAK